MPAAVPQQGKKDIHAAPPARTHKKPRTKNNTQHTNQKASPCLLLRSQPGRNYCNTRYRPKSGIFGQFSSSPVVVVWAVFDKMLHASSLLSLQSPQIPAVPSAARGQEILLKPLPVVVRNIFSRHRVYRARVVGFSLQGREVSVLSPPCMAT